jgi:flagellar basal body-associated protein FliL
MSAKAAGSSKGGKKGSDMPSKGGLNPIVVVVVLLAVAAGAYFSRMGK